MPASPIDSTSSSSRASAATEAAATEAGQPADTTTSDAPSGPSAGGAKAKAAEPVCPTCRGALERYAGAAAHKLGSFWCHVDGRRWHPHEIKAAQQDASPTDAAGSR